ncbi:translocation/assembly module TamB domain-containing protein [Bdellovibrionota bacterium]
MIKRVLLITGALLLLLACIVTLMVRSSYVQNKLQALVIQEIKTNTEIDFNAEKIEMAIIPPAISIQNATIKKPAIFEIKSPKILLRLNTIALFRGAILLSSIQMISPEITILLENGEKGKASPQPSDVTSNSSIFENLYNAPLKKLTIENGNVYWQNKGFAAKIKHLSSIKQRGQFEIKSSLGPSSILFKERKWTINHAELNGTLEKFRIKLQDSSLTGPWGRLEATGMFWGGIFENSDATKNTEIDLQLKSVFNLDKFKFLFSQTDRVKGSFHLNGEVKNKISNPFFSGLVEGRQVIYNEIQVPHFTGDINANLESIEFKPLAFLIDEGRVELTGTLRTKDPSTFEGVAEFENVPVEEALRAVAVNTNPVRANVSGAISVNGNRSPFNLNYTASLTVKEFGVGAGNDIVEFDEGIIETGGILDAKKITFDNAQVMVKDGGTIAASGKIDFSGPLRFDYFTDRFQLGALGRVGKVPIDGIAKIVGSVTDSPNKPTIAKSTTRIEKFNIANYKLGWIRGEVTFAKNIVDISSVTIRKGESEYKVKSKVDVNSGIFKKSTFAFKKLQYQDLRQTVEDHLTLPEWIDGEFKGRLTLEGPPTIEELKSKVSLLMSNGVIAGEEFDLGLFVFNVQGGKLSLQKSILKKPKGQFKITGGMELNKSVNLNFTSTDAEYADITFLKRNKIPLDGTLQIKGSIQGPWESPKGIGSITISQVSLAGEPLPASILNLQLKKKKLSAHWELENHQMYLKSWTMLDGNYPFELSMKAKKYKFDPFLSLISRAEDQLKGEMQGSIDVSGELSPFKLNHGDFALQQIQIRRGSLTFQNRDPVRIKISDSGTTIHPFHLVGRNTDLMLGGSISPGSLLNLQLNGSFDLFLLEFFSKPVTHATGTGRINAKVTGHFRRPELLGNFSLHDSAIQTSWLPQPTEQLNADIVFSQRLISIEKATAKWGGGPVTLTGTITNPAEAPLALSLHLTSRNNQLQPIKGFYTRLSSELHLTGKDRPYLLSGKITVNDATYREKINWKSNLFKSQPKYTPKVIKEEFPFISLDVDVNATKGVKIDNNIAKITFEGNLKIIGDTERPNLKGNLTLVEGKTFFRDSEFKLTTGEIDFSDPLEVNPYFHLRAESKVRDYLINVAMNGYLGDYDVQLSSQPSLSESDIAALLTLGITSEDIAGQEGQFAALELGSLLFGGFSEVIERETGRNIGIKFRVTPSYSTTKGATIPKVIVGTELFKDIEASFASSIGDSAFLEEKEARIEYKINENISLQGVWEDQIQTQQVDDSKIGLDVTYQFEFK